MPQRHIALMKLIKKRVSSGEHKSQQSPITLPASSRPANRTKNEDAEHAKFRDMSELADPEMQMANQIR